MEIKGNVQDRKALVKALSEHLGLEATYMGPPTFAYQVGNLTIGRDGTVETEDEAQHAQAKAVMINLGYIVDEAAVDDLQVQVPIEGMDGFALRNLIFMLSSKQYLLNRVLQREHFHVSNELVDALKTGECSRASEFHSIIASNQDGLKGLSFADDNAEFTFPVSDDPVKNRALVTLAALMVNSAKQAKRVDPTNQVVENEKYYLRIWLIHLGLSGRGGQETRRTLLDGLKGHTAFRTPEDAARFSANQKAKREAAKAAAAALEVSTPAPIPAAEQDADCAAEKGLEPLSESGEGPAEMP